MEMPLREAQKTTDGAIAYVDDDDKVLAELGYVVSCLPVSSREVLSSPHRGPVCRPWLEFYEQQIKRSLPNISRYDSPPPMGKNVNDEMAHFNAYLCSPPLLASSPTSGPSHLHSGYVWIRRDV